VESNKVKRLKEALLSELIDQVENGITAVDRESGEVVKLSTDSRVLTVAAKVVKDLATRSRTRAPRPPRSSAWISSWRRAGFPKASAPPSAPTTDRLRSTRRRAGRRPALVRSPGRGLGLLRQLSLLPLPGVGPPGTSGPDPRPARNSPPPPVRVRLHEAKTLPVAEQLRISGAIREDIIRAFRGLGKSYITATFAIWLLMRNPRDEKVLVLSATGDKAKEFVTQVKSIIASMPMLLWLLEGSRANGAVRRDEADQFDVTGASLSQSYSVKARGITGQITGSRATTLIADDIEIPQNSKTEAARAEILRIIRSDFVPITKTEHGKGDILFLGTPQTEESVYNVLVVEMGFRCFCIPVRYPTVEKLKSYTLMTEGRVPVDIMAPYLVDLFSAAS
jgi:hypothetical protein